MVVIVQPAILRIFPQVVEIDWRVHASKQNLELLLVEHPAGRDRNRQHFFIQCECSKRSPPQPLRVDDLRQALKERIALLLDLLRESVVCDEVYVLQPILACHRNITPVRD